MPDCVIELLGAPGILLGNIDATPKRQKSLALLAYLLTEPRLHARARLAALLWPDASDARKLLRHAIYELRQGLGSDGLIGDRASLGIDGALAACCDFNRLHQLAEHSDHSATALPLAEVETLCSGEFLEGFAFDDSDVMADWCYAMRELVARRRGRLLERQVAAHRALGDTETALALLARWQRLDKLNESVHLQLIELYLQRHEPWQAERVFEEYKRVLYAELGITPSSGLTQLVAGMHRQDVAAPTDADKPQTPETHYLQCGEIFLAYQSVGSGPVTLIVVNGFMSHLEQIWENPQLADFYRQLARRARLVLFDKRGSGMSDRVAEAPTPGDIAADIHHLVTGLQLERVSLFGFSEGGAAAIEFASRYPRLTERLILYGAAAKWTRDTEYRPALTPEQFAHWREQLVRDWGNGACIGDFAPSQAQSPAVINWWAKTMRLSSSPGEVSRILRSIRDIDVRSRLVDIQCPTSILHKTDDRVVRFGAAEYLAQHLPRARLMPLAGRDHWFWTEQPGHVVALILGALSGAA